MEQIRETGKKSLKDIITKEKNISIIENNVYKITKDLPNFEVEYKTVMYQVISDIQNGIKLCDILEQLKNKRIGWNHVGFEDWKYLLEEQDNFIENPFEVEEGALECKKCGSKKVFYYQKQCRGSDESSTTFATCVKCGSKWSYSG